MNRQHTLDTIMIYAQYFAQEEFRDWAEDMSQRLVTMLEQQL